jgi:hypothetical protein
MDTHRVPGRFHDPFIWLYTLAADDIEVVCPRCGGRAMVIAQRAEGTSAMFGPRRFLCAACVSAASWSPKGQTPHWGAPVDPFFGFRYGCKRSVAADARYGHSTRRIGTAGGLCHRAAA